MNVSKGFGIALAVSSLLAVGCGSADDGEDTKSASQPIVCQGGNSCAGHSECASAEAGSTCKGSNSCAGMGWVYADSEAECKMLQEANKAS